MAIQTITADRDQEITGIFNTISAGGASATGMTLTIDSVKVNEKGIAIIMLERIKEAILQSPRWPLA